jgi:hypothetical protein
MLSLTGLCPVEEPNGLSGIMGAGGFYISNRMSFQRFARWSLQTQQHSFPRKKVLCFYRFSVLLSKPMEPQLMHTPEWRLVANS